MASERPPPEVLQLFETRDGSRGPHRRRSSGRLATWIQRRMAQHHRRKGHRFMGMDVLILTTTGRKTGQQHETPVAWFPDGDDAWLIVASAAGSAQHPGWYRNIAAHPDRVWIELRDRKLQVSAQQLRGQERAERWQRIIAAQPRYQKYQARTDRELPVIRLSPGAPGPRDNNRRAAGR